VIKYSISAYKVTFKEAIGDIGVIEEEFETPNDEEIKKLTVVKAGWKLLPLKLKVTLAVFEIELEGKDIELLKGLY
jgi:hypothetical protein